MEFIKKLTHGEIHRNEYYDEYYEGDCEDSSASFYDDETVETEPAQSRSELQVPPAYEVHAREETASETEPTIEASETVVFEEPIASNKEISDEQLDKLGDLDFSMLDPSEPENSLEQIALPDPEKSQDEPALEVQQISPYEESAQITAGGDKPLHKRSVPKVAIGVGIAVLVAGVGSMMSGGTSTQSSTTEDPAIETTEVFLPGSTPESNSGELQAQLTSNELEAELEARQAAKEQQAKAEKEAADAARRNQPIGYTPPAPTTSTSAAPVTPSRVFYPSSSTRSAAPTPRYSSPRASSAPPAPKISSNRVVIPKEPIQSQVPAIQPRAVAPPSNPETEIPTMLAFGSMPDLNSGYSSDLSALPAAQSFDRPAPFEQPTSTLVAQQEAFLSGRKQTQIRAGQTIKANIEGQYLAQTDTEFVVRTTSAVLGLQGGSLLRAKVTGLSGKYVGAEVISLISSSGYESPVPPGAVTVSSSSGKLLKASSNKGFFQSVVGKGLLGFGRGAADQFISRTESFSNNQYGSNFTRGAGSKDLTSVLGSGLRGFADPILQAPTSGESALTLNPGAVQLNINASFSIAQ